MAKVVLPKAGTHRLRVRRWAAARAEEAGVQILSLPVNPTPIALLSIDPPGDGIPQGEAVARGRIERRPDGSLAGRLGPADRLVVRWAKSGGAARDAGPVDAHDPLGRDAGRRPAPRASDLSRSRRDHLGSPVTRGGPGAPHRPGRPARRGPTERTAGAISGC